jgi:hypothetical protein
MLYAECTYISHEVISTLRDILSYDRRCVSFSSLILPIWFYLATIYATLTLFLRPCFEFLRVGFKTLTSGISKSGFFYFSGAVNKNMMHF